MALTGGQLWLRQSDHGLYAAGCRHHPRRRRALRGKRLTATGQRVPAGRPRPAAERGSRPTGDLADGALALQKPARSGPEQLPEPPATISLPTDLTVARVQESFASPDTLSVWALPGFIALLDRSGFSSIRHRLHFQSLLALPLLCATMALVAAGFSMRPARRGGVAQMIGSGVAAGFALFVVSKIAEEFGQSGALPVTLAAWAPAASGLMLAVALLLHMEDG